MGLGTKGMECWQENIAAYELDFQSLVLNIANWANTVLDSMWKSAIFWGLHTQRQEKDLWPNSLKNSEDRMNHFPLGRSGCGSVPGLSQWDTFRYSTLKEFRSVNSVDFKPKNLAPYCDDAATLPTTLFLPPRPLLLVPVCHGFLCSQDLWIVLDGIRCTFLPHSPKLPAGFSVVLPSFIPRFSAVGLGWGQSLPDIFRWFSLRALDRFLVPLSASVSNWGCKASARVWVWVSTHEGSSVPPYWQLSSLGRRNDRKKGLSFLIVRNETLGKVIGKRKLTGKGEAKQTKDEGRFMNVWMEEVKFLF